MFYAPHMQKGSGRVRFSRSTWGGLILILSWPTFIFWYKYREDLPCSTVYLLLFWWFLFQKEISTKHNTTDITFERLVNDKWYRIYRLNTLSFIDIEWLTYFSQNWYLIIYLIIYIHLILFVWKQQQWKAGILISWCFKQCLAIPYKGQWTLLPFLTSEFPVQPLYSLPLTRYRNHFLCVASFHYTPDYSDSCPSPLHFLFPSFSFPLVFFILVHTNIFSTTGQPHSIYPTLSPSFIKISVIPTVIEGDTCRKCLACLHTLKTCMCKDMLTMTERMLPASSVQEWNLPDITWCRVRHCEHANH